MALYVQSPVCFHGVVLRHKDFNLIFISVYFFIREVSKQGSFIGFVLKFSHICIVQEVGSYSSKISSTAG